MRTIPMAEWGKDHWSMLAYVECQCVDHGGVIDRERMRCNSARHMPGFRQTQFRWQDAWSTRLAGGKREPGHDDWDALDDLASAGLVTVDGTGIAPVCQLTDLGRAFAQRLRVHKQDGGSFSTFSAPQATA